MKYEPLVMAFEPRSAAEVRAQALRLMARRRQWKPVGPDISLRQRAAMAAKAEEESARQKLREAPITTAPRGPGIPDGAMVIISSVAKFYGIGVDTLRSKNRTQKVVRPRQVAMYLLNKYSGYSDCRIGRLFHRHHTTVIHSIKQAKQFVNDLNAISTSLNAELECSKNLQPSRGQQEVGYPIDIQGNSQIFVNNSLYFLGGEVRQRA